jgi:hypothetical protein
MSTTTKETRREPRNMERERFNYPHGNLGHSCNSECSVNRAATNDTDTGAAATNKSKPYLCPNCGKENARWDDAKQLVICPDCKQEIDLDDAPAAGAHTATPCDACTHVAALAKSDSEGEQQ